MGFLTRCKRPFLFAFLLQFCNMLFSFFLKTFLILFEKQHRLSRNSRLIDFNIYAHPFTGMRRHMSQSSQPNSTAKTMALPPSAHALERKRSIASSMPSRAPAAPA